MTTEEKIKSYIEREFPFEMDYSKSFIRMIGEGDYTYVNGDFINRFDVPGELAGTKVSRIGRLFLPKCSLPGYRASSIFELLAFAANFPDVVSQLTIYCADSWKNDVRVWERVYIAPHNHGGIQLNSGAPFWTGGVLTSYLRIKM